MDRKTAVFVSLAFLVFLVGGLYVFSDWFSKTTGYALGEDQKIRIAQCLDSKSSVFYVSEKCPECDKQKELLGEEAFSLVNVVECGDTESCPEELKGVPAWRINREYHYGFRDFKELIEISGCAVEEQE